MAPLYRTETYHLVSKGFFILIQHKVPAATDDLSQANDGATRTFFPAEERQNFFPTAIRAMVRKLDMKGFGSFSSLSNNPREMRDEKIFVLMMYVENNEG